MGDWKVLHVFSNGAEATIFIAQLDLAEIPHVEQDYTSIFGQSFYASSLGGIKVLVPERHYDEAKKLLETFLNQQETDINAL